MPKFECFAVKERGFSHIKNNIVCQDNCICISKGQITVISVADGHGSPQYFRSGKGSEFAVKCAAEKFLEFSSSLTIDDMDSEKKRDERINQLIHSIITQWHECVKNDYESNPFTAEELEIVPEKYRVAYESRLNAEKAYGTTLIAAADNGIYSVGIHIGDGKCIAVYDDGSVDEPVPWDEKCHLNQCTSLCDAKAADEFRFYIWEDKRPVAIIVCSDGIDDSYGNFVHDYCKSVLLELTDGNFAENVEKLEKELPQISKNGSKDDVSIAGMLDLEKIKKMRPLLETDIKLANIEKNIVDANNKKNDLIFTCEKADRIYEKAKTAGISGEELKTKENKCRELAKELEEINNSLSEYEKRKAELTAHRQLCISGEHTAITVCPECGCKLNIQISEVK
ncbi:MAG: protein phosphatase 2C domain-containing protein [Ruminococcus sp.]|nr:protein phosphatase 2C domain-containing protein [Ruminococcus sp.]MCM1381577.1 protein phosphatase 2C domain-containing protein [Muribaculaceae bacterium]MCM1479329.1 protein phosphatase 2C domain-containing protein [Muribaculaceae bacterium]